MDKKFLNKVLDQIVRETEMDYEKERAYTPFYSYIPYYSLSYLIHTYRSPFTKHCNNIYGLNDDEVKYVWKEYREIVKDKLKNNG
jgi:Cys-tRNA synthase (O-phospho-L-seryl-tRNA:Cys-tRNA synthase)